MHILACHFARPKVVFFTLLQFLPPSRLTEPPSPVRQLRFVCMSDTHSLTPHLSTPVPDGDVFVHAGDFTKCGRAEEVEMFNSWLGTCLLCP